MKVQQLQTSVFNIEIQDACVFYLDITLKNTIISQENKALEL